MSCFENVWPMVRPGLPRSAAVLACATSLAACSLFAPAPLDPVIGDTGQPLSELARQYDVLGYEINLTVEPSAQHIAGYGATRFVAMQPMSQVELKLDSRFDISRAEFDEQPVSFNRQAGTVWVQLPRVLAAGETATVRLHYAGEPHRAVRAPWDGGTVWSKTPAGQPWIATAVQGEGCDLWWPCKDHFRDKPEQVDLQITVPAALSVASNGVLQSITDTADGQRRFHWRLSVPASDYNIALNIGPYVRIQEQYTSVNGATVPIEFWALPENETRARQLINDDLRHQLAFYETVLGPYPWGNEKLGFVETPHLGMEHQTINAYGKGYKRDENGYDWLMQHELAHEWFGNLMTHAELNDAWLHEGYGFYMQPAYSKYRFGEAAYHAAMYKSYLGLKNCAPVVLSGHPTSAEAFNSDIYGKGGWTLHTLRWLIGDTAFWTVTRTLLYGTADTAALAYPIVPRYRNTDEFIALVNEVTGKDWRWLFDVYLRQAALPELVTERNGERLQLRWQGTADKPFPMPVPVSINGVMQTVPMPDGRGELAVKATDHLIIDPQMSVLRQLPIIGDCREQTEKAGGKK